MSAKKRKVQKESLLAGAGAHCPNQTLLFFQSCVKTNFKFRPTKIVNLLIVLKFLQEGFAFFFVFQNKL